MYQSYTGETDRLNPAEVTEAVTAIYDTGYTVIALFLTVFSGYMVVAYTVGAKLKASQLIFINFLFVVFTVIFAFGGYMFITSALDFSDEYGGGANPFGRVVTPLILIVQLLGVVGALLFMNDIRKTAASSKKAEDLVK